MTDIGAVLARVDGELFQNSWVVEDLAAAEAAMRTTLGCDEFVGFEMDPKWHVRGETISSPMTCGFARSGNMQIELMQPLGAGPHHLGVRVDDLDAAVAVAGVPAAMSADFGPLRLAFLDTIEALGLYIELLEDPDGMLWATKPWRDDRTGSDKEDP